jgi:hypothetical protein
MLRAGAAGFVLKGVPAEELHRADCVGHRRRKLVVVNARSAKSTDDRSHVRSVLTVPPDVDSNSWAENLIELGCSLLASIEATLANRIEFVECAVPVLCQFRDSG